MSNGPLVKVFAAPGIDSHPSEQGVFNSGSGFGPQAPTAKTGPHDWASISREQTNETGELIAGFPQSKAPTAASLKIRKRGISPFTGNFKTAVPTVQKRGGIADMNPGAGNKIAGGKAAGSSLVRTKFRDNKQNTRPVYTQPPAQRRGLQVPLPTGGSHTTSGQVPVLPTTGAASIFGFIAQGSKNK